MSYDSLLIRQLGLKPWSEISAAMHQFTDHRSPAASDEVWLAEHPAVFTLGQASKAEHLLAPGDIPVMQSDRGGQVTYHGPGQQMMYVLINLRHRKLSIRQLVTVLEQTVIATLAHWQISASARPEAPGVYVDGRKICSLGLRIRNGCSLHGLALNVSMDLSPFQRINPCGYAGLEMTQLSDYVHGITLSDLQPVLVAAFAQQLAITEVSWQSGGTHFLPATDHTLIRAH